MEEEDYETAARLKKRIAQLEGGGDGAPAPTLSSPRGSSNASSGARLGKYDIFREVVHVHACGSHVL